MGSLALSEMCGSLTTHPGSLSWSFMRKETVEKLSVQQMVLVFVGTKCPWKQVMDGRVRGRHTLRMSDVITVTDGVTSPRSVPGGTVTTETPRLGGVNPAPPVVVHDPAPPAVVHDPGDRNHDHPVAQEVDRPVVVPRVRHLAVPDLNPVATQNPSPHVVQDPLDSRGQQEIGQEARNDQTLVIGAVKEVISHGKKHTMDHAASHVKSHEANHVKSHEASHVKTQRINLQLDQNLGIAQEKRVRERKTL